MADYVVGSPRVQPHSGLFHCLQVQVPQPNKLTSLVTSPKPCPSHLVSAPSVPVPAFLPPIPAPLAIRTPVLSGQTRLRPPQHPAQSRVLPPALAASLSPPLSGSACGLSFSRPPLVQQEKCVKIRGEEDTALDNPLRVDTGMFEREKVTASRKEAENKVEPPMCHTDTLESSSQTHVTALRGKKKNSIKTQKLQSAQQQRTELLADYAELIQTADCALRCTLGQINMPGNPSEHFSVPVRRLFGGVQGVGELLLNPASEFFDRLDTVPLPSL
ncbi:hypothetical protein CB1_000932013 [Camelus ferus]|nr:hypothetical protein CB1_000932013 [Camelus ferus]